jgi:cyanophycinase
MPNTRRRFQASLVAGILALPLIGAQTLRRGGSAGAFSTPAARTGTLVLVGGGTTPDSVRERFVELAGGKEARIVIIPSASARFDAPAQSLAYWKTAHVKSVKILHTTSRGEADDPRFADLLQKATGVWLAGGDQNRLLAIFGGTRVERELKAVLRRGGVIGGTSAGASAPSDLMMTGEPEAGRGFGLLAGVTVDQHFSNRHRLPRLLAMVQGHPGRHGIGIDEATAVVIRGTEVSVLGTATVTVARPDGSLRVYRAGGRFGLARPILVASR